jgi:hypothetical protein
MDVHLARLEGAYEQISDRLNGIDVRFERVEGKIDGIGAALRSELAAGFARVDGELAGLRKTIVGGGFAIGAFIFASIIIPLIQHGR